MGSGLQIAGTILGGLQVGKAIGQSQESAAQQAAIREQMTQQRLALAQRSTVRTEKMRKVIGSQIATEAARGVSLSSPTFQSISQKSFRNFKEDENADSLNTSFRESFLKEKLRQEKLNLYGEFAEDLESGAKEASSLFG